MLSIIRLRLLRLRDDILIFVLMTAMAFALTAIFGFSFGNSRPLVLIVDEDGSSYSGIFAEELKAYDNIDFMDSDMKNAAAKVEEGKAHAALIISKGFGEDVKKGEQVSLGIMKLKDDTVLYTLRKLASDIAQKMAGGLRTADVIGDYICREKPEAEKNALAASAYNKIMEAWKYRKTVSVAASELMAETGGYQSFSHSMIGFSIYFSMYTMVFGIGTILNDRQYKTWHRMLISPVSRFSILGGTMAVAYMTGVVQMAVLILGGKYLFGMHWGSSIPGILTVAGAFIFAVTSMGLMLSGIVRTHAQLSALCPVVLTSTSMIGGCMWPLDIVNNKVLLFLAELTPQKWAMEGMESIASKGMGFEAAVIPVIVLMAMGILFFIVGLKLMKSEQKFAA